MVMRWVKRKITIEWWVEDILTVAAAVCLGFSAVCWLIDGGYF